MGNILILRSSGFQRSFTFSSTYILFLALITFFLFPAEVTSFGSMINYKIPKPTGLWYGIYKEGLTTSFINVVELVIFFVLFGLILQDLIRKRISIKIDSILIVLIWFYVVSLFSLVYNYNFTYSGILDIFPLDGVVNLGKAMLIYFILLQLADHSIIRKLLIVLLYIGLVLALVSIVAFFSFGYFTYQERYLGWRVNVLGMGVNTGGIFLSCIAMIAYNLKRERSVYYLYLVPIVLAILLTGSRQAFISLVVSIFIYHLLVIRENKKGPLRFVSVFFVTLTIYFVIAFTGVFGGLHQLSGFTVFARLGALEDIVTDVSAFSRIFIWWNYIRILSEHILFGIGNSDWLIEIISRPYGYPHPVPHSHSIIIQTLIKGGILATIPILWVFIRSELGALKSKPMSVHFIAGIAALPIILSGLIGYAFWNQKLVYLFTVLLFCLCYNNRKNPTYILKLA